MERTASLEGITVIDFTAMMAGPFATRMLADCGADVIKLEPLTGDYMRYRSPIRNGRSAYYGQMNSGKKSVAIDLKSPEGRAIALDLVSRADAIVENYRPEVMAGLGLDYDTLHKQFPRLVYCSITGFGQKGERARDPAYAPIIHAASGYDMAHLKYNEGLERPATTGIFTADVISAIYAFGAIQTALLHRERFGVGQHVDVTLIDAMLNMLVYEMQEAQFQTTQRRPLYQPLKAADGFVMAAPVNQKNFEGLAIAIGHPEWNQDPRFSTITAREHNWGMLMELIEEWTLSRPAAECEATLMRAGVPCSRYKTVGDLLAEPAMIDRGTFEEVSDGSGPFSIPRQPFTFSDAPVVSRPHVSDLGEDTAGVLGGMLGMDEARIADLRARKVLL
ncbi:CaiB/BaiF CoA transferase family protein [Sphingomonas chungangi]|nr:CoA transferase [Sphingomonas chungangi]